MCRRVSFIHACELGVTTPDGDMTVWHVERNAVFELCNSFMLLPDDMQLCDIVVNDGNLLLNVPMAAINVIDDEAFLACA